MKILIVKTGETESFDLSSKHLGIISLGDVVRTSTLLHAFKDDDVTWFTSQDAEKLLRGIPGLSVKTALDELEMNSFDLVINLERTPAILAHLKPNSKMCGFVSGEGLFIDGKSFKLNDWLGLESIRSLNWSEKLYALVGKKWRGENYILPREMFLSSLENEFDIGLNWQVGSKWPTKKWHQAHWEKLHSLFSDTHTVSWQQGFDDLSEYMNWINSCKVLITHDSLGLHIARALNKKIIVLFGPTSSLETPLGTKAHALSALDTPGFDCLPCYKEECHNKIHCMEYLSVEMVAGKLRTLLKSTNE